MAAAIPARLYKYQSSSIQSITNLSSGKIWFSDPKKFNDPFDCGLKVEMKKLSEADTAAVLDDLARASGEQVVERFRRLPADLLQQQIASGLKGAIELGLSGVQGVSCFSEKVDDLLMWGHYAEGHRGFCLEFDTSLDKMFQLAKQVTYSNRVPAIDHAAVISGRLERVLDLVLTKAQCWEYEKEWRVLHKDANLSYGYERQSLVGVYLGAAMPEPQQLMVCSLLSNTNTKLYKMSLAPGEFSLIASAMTFAPIDYRTRATT